MKKIVRLTESDLTRIVKRIIEENKKQNLREGIGTGLLVLTGVGVFYLARKLKKFIDKYGKDFASTRLVLLLSKVKAIEDGRSEGEIVVKESDDYIYILIKEGNQVFDSITIDMVNGRIYNGHSKKPKASDMFLPKSLPASADTENMEEIEEAENELVNSILDIVERYGKKKDEEEESDY